MLVMKGRRKIWRKATRRALKKRTTMMKERKKVKPFCGLFLLLYLSPLSVYPFDAHRCKISLNVKSKNALSFYLFIVYCDVVNVQTHFNFSKEIILLNLEKGVN